MEGDKSPPFWRWVSAEGWKIRTLAHTGCLHSQLCEEQSWTIISSSFNPLVEQPGDPLSEQERKSRAICREAKHAFRSNLSTPTAHSRVHAVVRSKSTPKDGKNSKKHANLLRLRTKEGNAQAACPSVWKIRGDAQRKLGVGLRRLVFQVFTF